MKWIKCCVFLTVFFCRTADAQNYTEILGRPTDRTVTMSILFDRISDVFWEYGNSSGIYTFLTDTFVTKQDTALENDFINLQSDTRYFYRTRYRPVDSTGGYAAGSEHSFVTQKAVGHEFRFAIEADPHLDTNSIPEAYTLTLQNIASRNPDFFIDLGDNFMSEKLPLRIQSEITQRLLLYRPYFNIVSNSSPLFLVLGNHEGELGWMLDGTSGCLPVMTSNTRKVFYPNPYPNTFYKGDSIPENFVGLRGNYYSWHWGDALFVVLDPFWYCTTKGGWGYTLGEAQYLWFKKILSESHDKFRFVFCHNLVGGKSNDARGGEEYAGFYEMGGQNADSTWGFTTNRPGWDKTLHQLMVDYKVNIFFHGHDHLYAKQTKDGLIYQEVPQPSSRNITSSNASQLGYVHGVILPGRGYLLVTVADTGTRVDYIRTYLPNEESGGHTNGEIADTYSISPVPQDIHEKTGDAYSFSIKSIYPNPFTDETSIEYCLSRPGSVKMQIFDLCGNEISGPVAQYQEAGLYSVKISARQNALKPGIYFCGLNMDGCLQLRKLICIQ